MTKYAITHHNLSGHFRGTDGKLDKTFYTHIIKTSESEYKVLKELYPTIVNHIEIDRPNLDLKSLIHAICMEFDIYIYIQKIESND